MQINTVQRVRGGEGEWSNQLLPIVTMATATALRWMSYWIRPSRMNLILHPLFSAFAHLPQPPTTSFHTHWHSWSSSPFFLEDCSTSSSELTGRMRSYATYTHQKKKMLGWHRKTVAGPEAGFFSPPPLISLISFVHRSRYLLRSAI